MRVAFLCKRHYMGKDVVLDRYARLYELPRQLARCGHDVLAICLDYHSASAGEWRHEAAPGTLKWRSHDAGRLVLPGLWRHARGVLSSLREFRPGVVVSSSDVYHVVLGHLVAGRLGVPHVVDLYDNYASFGMGRIPLLATAYRYAVAHAAAVSCVSAPLERMIREQYGVRARTLVLESTINEGAFFPADQHAARRALGLPASARIIGYAGALDESRGIECLYRAFDRVAVALPDVRLALAGPVGRPSLPKSERIHYLGLLSHEQVARFYPALDIGVICVKDSVFGRYSFPQKAYEMLASGIPLVVARVGAMQELFARYPGCTYPAGSVDALEQALLHQLRMPVVPDIPVPTWEQQGRRLSALLDELTGPAQASVR